MSVKCVKCGAELPDGVAFCTECGTKVVKPEAAPEAGPAPQSAPQEAPRTVPQPAPVNTAATELEKPVGFLPYFGLMVLFVLPVVGFISILVFSFAPKSKSLKNFARATLAWKVIAVVLGIIFAIVGFTLFSAILSSFSGGLSDLDGLLDSIRNSLPQ